jgi:uncharacterized protein (UPF0332 family)
VTPEASLFILKAYQLLRNAKIMFDAGLIADAGRTAYLAGFHAVRHMVDHITALLGPPSPAA